MKKEIEVAAKWWADQLRGRPKHDNGDSMHNAMFAMAASYLPPVDESKVDKFEQLLIERLPAVCGEYGEHIGVDYGPDLVLINAANDAEIDTGYRFPVKTNMWIQPGCVKVSCGYRAPIEILYAVDQDPK